MSTARLEKLKVVFSLEGKIGSVMQIGEDTLEQIVKTNGIGDVHALQVIVGIMKQLGIVQEFKRNNSTYISASAFTKQVESKNKWSNSVEAGGLMFSFGNLTALKQSFLLIEEKKVGAAGSWDTWVSPFLTEPTFVQAWISDVEYDHWQNATDPLEYMVVGRDYSRLLMKNNGLPFPLEKQVIDTSKNPGRWNFQLGYIEAIGSVMWLGELFWTSIGADKRPKLKTIEWLQVQQVTNNVIKLKAADQCFFDETSEKLQVGLRALLFDL